jgi:uncharacterized protein YbjT (DUF2867 family)
MNVLLLGATGMVGQGVLRECLRDPDVERILCIGRSPIGQQHTKLREIIHENLLDLSSLETELTGYDACFFCLGISSAGMGEANYMRITYDITLAVARTLSKHSPAMVFIYVSGTGTDSTEQGRTMWARVKGKTENALLQMPFKAAYMFRPGFIQPLHGIKSKTPLYRYMYTLTSPLHPVLKALFPRWVTTTEQVGRAMLNAVKHGTTKRYLENQDINQLAQA